MTIFQDADRLLAPNGVNVTNLTLLLVQRLGDLRCSAGLSMGTALLFTGN